MIFHPVPYKWCSLTEACEWIAFGWKPVPLIYKHVDGTLLDDFGEISNEFRMGKQYLRAIHIASYKLLIAIYEHKLAAIGSKTVNYQYDDTKLYRIRLSPYSTVDFDRECIKCQTKEYDYMNVFLNFTSVQKCFPRDENGNPIIEETKQKKIGYNSLYMEIMDKVIDDLSITEKNQPSKKSIYYHVLAKYAKKYNLSNNTIQMIASLVLNPESRLGKAKK